MFDVVNKIDTSRTVISQYCPRYLLGRRCELRRYRDVEGLCNNLNNPHWGASMIAHSRFLPVSFGDGISAPRISVTGRQLPSARLVSQKLQSLKQRLKVKRCPSDININRCKKNPYVTDRQSHD